ncbi:MAG: DUF438 domain-containing protein [Spirochaetes bacterium]|nr:DUF438 domain-containing protein [Spirochaetota bacterium]
MEKINIEKQEKLKKIIHDLHKGISVEKVKNQFKKLIKNVSAEEISEMEMSLINEGFKPEEIQKLCNVHVSVFEKSLSKQKKPSKIEGHPVHTYMLENKEAKKIIKKLKSSAKSIQKGKTNSKELDDFKTNFENFKKINFHYQRKENQLFPFLEKKGFSGPSKVMWGKHDEIRTLIKNTENFLNKKQYKEFYSSFKELAFSINKMIFMEERILFPTSLSKLNETDWARIKLGESDIGYSWIKPSDLWDANMIKKLQGSNIHEDKKEENTHEKNSLSLEEGKISLEILNLILKNLPFDISYVDENDTVRYYSANAERIFPRSPGVIGRQVQNCHPHKSVHIVNKIIDSFKKKEKKAAEFWINMQGKLIHIRYFPIYDNMGIYKGIIELTQDVTNIKKLEGEKRLLEWE